MNIHPIKGTATLVIAGETRTLACDMNCAAVLSEAKGDHWNEWLVERFLGRQVETKDGSPARSVTSLTPADSITVLYALLASDREDSGRIESERSLRRVIGLADLPDLQLATIRAVLAGFGLPGEFIEAVVNAADEPRAEAAKGGTGTTF